MILKHNLNATAFGSLNILNYDETLPIIISDQYRMIVGDSSFIIFYYIKKIKETTDEKSLFFKIHGQRNIQRTLMGMFEVGLIHRIQNALD